MSNYIEIDGDATKPQLSNPTDIAVIPHVCNNIKKFGAGFTNSLNKTFGKGPYETYMSMDCGSPNGLKNFLGEISVCNIKDEGNIYVVNMIAQNGVIGALNPKPIKYWALMHCMERVKEFIGGVVGENPDREVVIHTCRFGSDLAMGNWEFIKELIEEIWVDSGIDVVIYNYKK
jgi:hypothetical protein